MRYYLYLALVYPLALLPFWALYLISDMLYLLLYKVLKYRIKVVRSNLESSFPEMTPEELKATERTFYHNLADIIVETIKFLHISDRQLRKRVVVTNGEIVDQVALPGTPIMLYLAHFGNWEWMTAMSHWYDNKRIHSGYIYKAMHDAAADRLMKRVRSRVDAEGIEIDRSVRTILRTAAEHPAMIVGFISDHRFNSASRRHSTPFLNHDTPYYVGAEALGRKVGAKFMYLDVVKTSRGHYQLTFVPINEEELPNDGLPDPITRQYYRMLEKTIRRNPGLWLWSHKRWI